MTSATFHIKEHILPSQHIREYARATAFNQGDILKIAVKQYIPIDNPDPQPGDVTIIGAHANGYPKELYEPLWIELHARSRASGFGIRGIWIADVAQQGASGVLNEHLLGDDPSWYDLARDLLHMINHFRAEMPLPMVAVGHSMGGCSLVNLSLMHPRLFTTVILMEPVINEFEGGPTGGLNTGRDPARLSTYRRDTWPSKAAAIASFRRQKYYQSWDPRVFDLWVEHGLRPTPTALYPDEANGTVTLSTTRHQEVWTFLRPRFYQPKDAEALREAYPDFDPNLPANVAFYRPEPSRTFQMLPHLRPSTLFIFGEESFMATSLQIGAKMRVTGTGLGGSGGAKEGRVKQVTLKGTGHLAPMEMVGECADLISEWMGKELPRWRKQQEAYKQWTKIPFRERQVVSEEWKTKVGRPPGRGPPAKAKM